MNLIEKLSSLQAAQSLSDSRFAAELGVSRAMWSKVRAGKKRPGRRFLSGVVRRYPSLTDDCLLHLRDGPDPAPFLPSNVTVSNL